MVDQGSSWRAAFRRRLGVDARALAAFRAALATVLLADLALRARHLRAFYTDAGVLPRAALRAHQPTLSALSLHAVSGEAWVQAALFAAAGAAAVALLVGYRTRTAAVVSWLLLVSLHARNPVVLSAGDSILRRLAFWGLFLPLGARWSVDARRRDGDPPDRVTSVASAALLLQVVAVYAVNGALKLRGETWLSGDAIRYVFALDAYTLPLGDALAAHPAVLSALSHAWLALLVASPLLIALTGRARTALVAAFAAAHVGMAATMRLGVFPLVSLAALVPFLPPWVWNRLSARAWNNLPGSSWSPTNALDRVLPRLPRPRPGPRTVAVVRRATSAVAVCVVVLLVAWNAAALGYVDAPDAVADSVSPQEHRWDMFAPEPRSAAVDYAATGTLASGEQVAVFDGARSLPPPRARSVRWRTYRLDLQYSGDALREAYVSSLCARWDRTHASDLAAVDVDAVVEHVRLDAPDTTERRDVAAGQCPG